MTNIKNNISSRKKDHIDICLNEDVNYIRTNGFEKYEFEHDAITEVIYDQISVDTEFLGSHINYPFMISSMTGGTKDAADINSKLAETACELNIPIGVGSQRELLESEEHLNTYNLFRDFSSKIPVLSNIGAAQISKMKDLKQVERIIDTVNAAALIVHCNPLQELVQREGEPDFRGLLKSLEFICAKLQVPVIVKEVGAGISKSAASKLLNVGVKGIDVAGAGGTSWSAVEYKRNGIQGDEYFRDWGLPTSYCLRTVNELKSDYDFMLIASGGIKAFDDIAKSVVLGADITASAKMILQKLNETGVEGVIEFVKDIFKNVKKIMYLTGCHNINELKKVRLLKKEELF